MIVACAIRPIMWIGCIKWSLFNNICGCGSLDSLYSICPHTRPVHFNNSPLYDVLDVASVALFPNIVSWLAVYIVQSSWGDMVMKKNMRWGKNHFSILLLSASEVLCSPEKLCVLHRNFGFLRKKNQICSLNYCVPL